MTDMREITRTKGYKLPTQYYKLVYDCLFEFPNRHTEMLIPGPRRAKLCVRGFLYCVLADVKNIFDSMREDDDDTLYTLYFENPEVYCLGFTDQWDLTSVSGIGIRCEDDSSGEYTYYPITIECEGIKYGTVKKLDYNDNTGTHKIEIVDNSGNKLDTYVNHLISSSNRTITKGDINRGDKIKYALVTLTLDIPEHTSMQYLSHVEVIEECAELPPDDKGTEACSSGSSSTLGDIKGKILGIGE